MRLLTETNGKKLSLLDVLAGLRSDRIIGDGAILRINTEIVRDAYERISVPQIRGHMEREKEKL